MKYALLLVPLLAGCANTPIPAETGSFDWLTGCWRLEREDGFVEEAWLPVVAGSSLGVGREIRGGKMVSHEFMRIELRGKALVFTAYPSGQAPVEFGIIEHAPGVLVFANSAHDFPTRIEYRYGDLNTLNARISGKDRVMDYPMQRATCDI
ncbi:MAG TPA: DUF6265 family protein [Verrucomicrobiae bacterium]|nr:DUF6265 family protein [Verrucomicrobiae bacterium]